MCIVFRESNRGQAFVPKSEIKEETEEANISLTFCSDALEKHRENAPYKCEACGGTYIGAASLRRHLRNVHSSAKVKCDVCNRQMTKTSIRRHRKEIHCLGSTQNEENEKKARDEEWEEREVHEKASVKKETETGEYCNVFCKVETTDFSGEKEKIFNLDYEGVECNICSQKYSSKLKLKKHIYNVHRMIRVKCDVCSKEVNKKSLDRHMKTVHSARVSTKKKRNLVPEEEKVPCTLCDKKCSNRVSLQNHMKNIHEAEQFKCNQCEFQGVRKQLEKHMKRQHSDEVYQCTRCQKILKSKSTLREHMWIHTDHRRFICDICGMRFKRTSNYHGHLKSHQDKKFQCQLCGNFFLRKRYLAIHEQTIHNFYGEGVPPQEKGYQCEVCGIKLKWKNNLLGHMRIHMGEKPYKCKICGDDFTCHGSLRTHMSKHDICPATSDVSNTFIQRAYLENRGEPTAPFAPSIFSSGGESLAPEKL